MFLGRETTPGDRRTSVAKAGQSCLTLRPLWLACLVACETSEQLTFIRLGGALHSELLSHIPFSLLDEVGGGAVASTAVHQKSVTPVIRSHSEKCNCNRSRIVA